MFCEIKKVCHSLSHRRKSSHIFKRFRQAYLAGQEFEDFESESQEDAEKVEKDEKEYVQHEPDSYMAFARESTSKRIPRKKTTGVLDVTLNDTGSNLLSAVGLPLFSAACVLNTHNIELVFDNSSKRITGIDNSIQTIGTIDFYFHVGGTEYSVTNNIVPGAMQLIISHEDLDELGLDYQTYQNTAD